MVSGSPNNDMLFEPRKKETKVSAQTDDDKKRPTPEPWKVMIIDDDHSIHQVTKMVLTDVLFAERELHFLSAYSAKEGKQLLADNPDTAILLLDVVMENDHARLEVVKYIREELGNNLVRIILRTGQPGQAPERQVITDYDINDYKEKTELTSKKLYTVIYASLRSYRDLLTIERNRKGLEQIIDSSRNVFELGSLNSFTEGVIEQLTSLMHLDRDAVYCHSLAARHESGTFPIIAATGKFSEQIGLDIAALNSEVAQDFAEAIKTQKNLYKDGRFIGYFKGNSGIENLLYVSGDQDVNQTDRNLLEIFVRNVAVAHDNIQLHHDLEETQREIVYMLGEAVETRSKETGNHVKRVAEISKLLAIEYGLDSSEAEILRLASPLHDIGKIGIPDAILNKPGRHSSEEFDIMKTHAQLGYDMLKASKRHILQAGAIIADQHHERWEGGGYPNNRKGKDIHIYGRITALADVFDALGSERCYKKAWPLEQVLDLIKEERSKQFDPELVDILLDNVANIVATRDQYADVFVADA